jgi:hypothetical protein
VATRAGKTRLAGIAGHFRGRGLTAVASGRLEMKSHAAKGVAWRVLPDREIDYAAAFNREIMLMSTA